MVIEQDMRKLNVTCDCAKCGMTMQNEKIISNDEYRARILFKCYPCDIEVVVNRWWQG